MPSQNESLRTLPEPDEHQAPDEDYYEEWRWQLDEVSITMRDTDGDGEPDERTRELYVVGVERLDCIIDDRWSRGGWHLTTTTRFEGLDKITTTYRDDRPISAEAGSSIVY